MNYVLELSQEQMIGRKARAEKYALMGRGFTIQPADNGLIVQPFEDDEDDIYTEEQIMHSKVVEVDED
jgi:hypothetical protein